MISNGGENKVLAGVIKGLEWGRRVQNPPQRVQPLPLPAHSSSATHGNLCQNPDPLVPPFLREWYRACSI
jgi:hypothetical protein